MRLKIKKGVELQLEGSIPSGAAAVDKPVAMVGICPEDFPGFKPKVLVKEGDAVMAGQPLMADKLNPETVLVSPANGVVKAVTRGERRKVEHVAVELDKPTFTTEITPAGDDFKAKLLASGLWAMMRQLPYDIVPDTMAQPRDIFVSLFDTAPLAVDIKYNNDLLREGVKALRTLTDGKIYIGMRPDQCPFVDGAENIEVEGNHPSSLPEVLAANVAPVNKGETVFTLDGRTLEKIGALARDGKFNASVQVAVTGPEVDTPFIANTLPGALISDILGKNLKKEDRHLRVVSGNVFTGTHESLQGFLRWPYRQITVILDGDDIDEFMGWASVSPRKMSSTRTFPDILLRRKHRPDSRINGGERAMIMSGIYDRAFPADIMPEYLLKAIIAKDIDQMEALGIYEVTPAMFGPAEYLDPSKLKLQEIVRNGLDYLKKELS